VQHHLAALATGQATHLAPRQEGSLDGFLAGLASAWQHGEIRATHRLAPRPARDWRTRKDPFERVWPSVRTWLEADPDRVGKELFVRLQHDGPAKCMTHGVNRGHSGVPTPYRRAEGHIRCAASARRAGTPRGRRPHACADAPRTGTGRSRGAKSQDARR
jgi:hypothetical protein